MDKLTERRKEMLVRVRQFGAAHGQLFPESSLAQQTFAAVAAAVDQVEAYKVAELSASKFARAARKDTAREALLDFLLKVRQTARVLEPSLPDLQGSFELPADLPDQVVVTAGRQFAKEAVRFAADFIAHGMPTTFLADLDEVVERFESALHERGVSREESLAARTRIAATVAAALGSVRKLDVIVANHLARDSVTCIVWKQMRRVDYPHPRKAAPPKPAAAEAAPAAPVVVQETSHVEA